MLASLTITDIVLIDRLGLDLAPGLCALTGETGAGKSILLDALGLATGARADKGLVRHGAREGAATAMFEIASDHPVWDALDEAVAALAAIVRGEGEAHRSDRPQTAAKAAESVA